MNESLNSDSIYSSPTSDISVPPEGDQMSAFVGPKYSEYYESVFSRFDKGASVSWNWSAFLVTAFWLLYRKMWAYSLTYWLLLPIVLAVIAGFVSGTQASPGRALALYNLLYWGAWGLIALIIMPMFANRLYYRHANKKLAKITANVSSADDQRLELARKGGTSSIIVVVLPIVLVFIIGILAAIAIPAYQDYTIRAQVYEGLNLSNGAKAGVQEYYLDQQTLPQNNEQAGLADANSILGHYVQSVEVRNGTITVTYGVAAHNRINGKSILMEPVIDRGSLSWKCYSDTIAPKHLPAMCR